MSSPPWARSLILSDSYSLSAPLRPETDDMVALCGHHDHVETMVEDLKEEVGRKKVERLALDWVG